MDFDKYSLRDLNSYQRENLRSRQKKRPGQSRRRRAAARAAAAKAEAESQSHSSKDGGGHSTAPQQPLPQDPTHELDLPDERNTREQEVAREETPEAMILDRHVEDITQHPTEASADDIEAEKDGPITMRRLTNDIAVLQSEMKKLARENSMLKTDLEKEREAHAEYQGQVNQEFRVYCLGMRVLAQRLGQDPGEFMQRMRSEAEEGSSFV
ncbi:hypothetical protein Daus18300_000817 [Diaporthe australafricana]|uniref:BZIP domain-containing protein n=1 Tax=Diaporthe australafricana TaxID=127596 RepID=A0ABR3Y1Z3_9PEZI